jgi:hypothetical protein
MSFIAFSGSRRAVAVAAFAAGLSATLAAAQAPTLSVSHNNVVPGASVTLTVVGTPGEESSSRLGIVAHPAAGEPACGSASARGGTGAAPFSSQTLKHHEVTAAAAGFCG